MKRLREEDRVKYEIEREEQKRKEKAERERVLREAKAEEERKKEEEKEFRKRVLREEEERLAKEKEKKKKEEEEFEDKVRKKFRAAGYSEEHIDSILHEKKEHRHSHDQSLAIDLQRPTFIKVHRQYLHPDTLDSYHLPWEWDSRDDNYIIIKKYISHDLQEELFEHTKMLHHRKLITGPYTKETTTTVKLKPANVVKDKDRMYIVREKSRSPSRGRRSSWMFT